MSLFKLPRHKGVINLLKHAIERHENSSIYRFAIIQIGDYRLQDVECPMHLAAHITPGAEVEITLSGVSLMALILVLIGTGLMFAGDASEMWQMEVSGVLLFVTAGINFFLSFVNMGHKICSLTVNGETYTR